MGGEAVFVKAHGPRGYRQGCRCRVCGDGERERQRTGVSGPSVPAQAPAAGGRRKQGAMERATRKLIRSMGLEGTPAQKLLITQAVAGAKALDEALAAGRPLSAAHRMHAQAVKMLEAAAGPPPLVGHAVDDDPGDVLLWVAALHRASVVCQEAYPAAVPGACADCDAAAEARVLYGRKHPDVPGHEYGMGREECRCVDCLAELAAATPDGQ